MATPPKSPVDNQTPREDAFVDKEGTITIGTGENKHTYGEKGFHDIKDAEKRSDESKGERDAGASIQTGICLVTDFIDPYVGAKIQQHLVKNYPSKQDKLKPDYDNETRDSWIAEGGGDFAALATYIGINHFAPRLLDKLKNAMAKTVVKPMYRYFGQKSIDNWAKHHHVEKGSERYNAKVAEWKNKQAESYAQTSFIAIGSTAFNVAIQKMIGNPHRVSIISAAKLSGSLITVAVIQALRALLPKTMGDFEKELGDRYFAPLIHWIQKKTGRLEKKTSEQMPAVEDSNTSLRPSSATETQLENAGDEEKGNKKNLGISRSIYALGESVKDSVIVGTVATVAFAGLFILGKDNKQVNQLKKLLYQSEHAAKVFLIECWNTLFHRNTPIKPMEDYTKKTPWAIALAFGAIASHIGQIPGLHRGYKKVDRAIKKYDALEAENEALKKKLAHCQEIEDTRTLATETEKPKQGKSWRRTSEFIRSQDMNDIVEFTR